MMKNEIFTNENKGFSLVELIVVIAIMAVMTSVLAPSLLGYVEQSRMAKDDSAMGEVNNAIKLALADQDVYDECLMYNVTNNYSCYVDETNKSVTASLTNADIDKQVKSEASGSETFGTSTGDNYWHFIDDMRLDDEKPYYAAGLMRGMTITFTASAATNQAEFVLANARINDIGKYTTARTMDYKYSAAPANGTVVKLSEMNAKTGGVAAQTDKNAGKLYNKLRAVIGDSVILSSQTYRNSEYTVFIRMGSMGGNNAAAQDAVAVYGQWNGTNLPYAAPAAGGGGT